jgi:hypothetical protein
MATALNGRARRIPLVQRLSFATRSASDWTVAACTLLPSTLYPF